MLGKLIRYDLKVQFKFLLGVYSVVAFVSVFAGVFQGLYDIFEDNTAITFAYIISQAFCIMAAIVVIIGTGICVVLYFRKNLFKDEGYLMHTLPVKAVQLYFSKLLTGIFCLLISFVVAYLCYGIGTLNIGWGKEILIDSIGDLYGISKFLIIIMSTLILSIPASLSQFYASISMGYTWKMNTQSPVNRDLLSIVSFVIIYMVQQFLSMIALVIYSFLNLDRFENFMYKEGALSYTYGIVILADILTVLATVVLSIIAIYRMKHHLNLE